MAEIIPDVKEFTSGKCPIAAGKLFLDLGESSFVQMVHSSDYGKRESDALADEALVALFSSASANQTTYNELPWETRRREWCEDFQCESAA